MGDDRPRRPRTEDREPTVYIGTKPLMAYVFEVAAQLNAGPGPVVIKARGNAIAKAVDVAEVVRRRLMVGQVSIGAIGIGTERLVNKDGRETNVSAITIPMSRTGPVTPAPPATAPPTA
jgi:DNA-binding protein